MKLLFITIILLLFGCDLFTDSEESKNTLTITLNNESYKIISNDIDVARKFNAYF